MGWHCKNTGPYARLSDEALDNTFAAYDLMYFMGFSLVAFCGIWGNVESESGYNPWRWQSDIVLPYDDPRIFYQNGHAYGLCQWDPASKYIEGGEDLTDYGPNYSDLPGELTDGISQLVFLDETAVSSGQYIRTQDYPLTYDEYKVLTIEDETVEYATEAWFWNYERGTWDDSRVEAAEYWYSVLYGYTPTQPRKIPIWLLFKLKEGNNPNV